MEVSQKPWGTQRLYQLLARGALVAALCSLFVWVWAMSEYLGYGRNLVLVAQQELVPTLAYFDWNRGQQPVTALTMHPSNTACGEGWETVPTLNHWPGTHTGCLVEDVMHVRRCVRNQGEQVEPTEGADLGNWRGSHFCVQRPETVAEEEVSDVSLKTAEESCPQGSVECNACECRRGSNSGVCPLTDVAVTFTGDMRDLSGLTACSTADSNGVQAMCGRDVGRQGVVGLQVEMYGSACRNPTRHPEAPSVHYNLLKVVGEGCRTLGSDDSNTLVADSQNESSFLQDNAEALGERRDLLTYQDTVVEGAGQAVLLARTQVQVTCSQLCQDFRFGEDANAALVAYEAAWGWVKVVCYVAGVMGLLDLVDVLLVVMVLKTKATQRHYTAMLVKRLVTATVLVVLLWITNNKVTKELNPARVSAETALVEGCVVDEGWNEVLAAYVHHTDLSSLGRWCAWLVGLQFVMVVGFVCLTVVVVRKLGALKTEENKW